MSFNFIDTTTEKLTDALNSIPVNTSDLNNDSGFITNSYHDNSKQDILISGTNIKTINNQSLLGNGDITIQGGSSEQSIYQKSATTTNTVILQDDTVIYTHTPTSNTTYTFSTSSLTQINKVITFEMVITMGATVRTLTFSGVSWINNEIPDMSIANQKYLLAFRSFDDGVSWVGNLQGWF